MFSSILQDKHLFWLSLYAAVTVIAFSQKIHSDPGNTVHSGDVKNTYQDKPDEMYQCSSVRLLIVCLLINLNQIRPCHSVHAHRLK